MGGRREAASGHGVMGSSSTLGTRPRRVSGIAGNVTRANGRAGGTLAAPLTHPHDCTPPCPAARRPVSGRRSRGRSLAADASAAHEQGTPTPTGTGERHRCRPLPRPFLLQDRDARHAGLAAGGARGRWRAHARHGTSATIVADSSARRRRARWVAHPTRDPHPPDRGRGVRAPVAPTARGCSGHRRRLRRAPAGMCPVEGHPVEEHGWPRRRVGPRRPASHALRTRAHPAPLGVSCADNPTKKTTGSSWCHVGSLRPALVRDESTRTAPHRWGAAVPAPRTEHDRHDELASTDSSARGARRRTSTGESRPRSHRPPRQDAMHGRVRTLRHTCVMPGAGIARDVIGRARRATVRALLGGDAEKATP